MKFIIPSGSHGFSYQKHPVYRNNGPRRGHQPKNRVFKILTHESIDFSRGFSQCQRWIHSSTQMMCYIDFSKYRFFEFFLDCSPDSENFPQACRDLPGRFATLPDPENWPKTMKNAIWFENYFFNCWRQFLFLTAFKH